MLVAAVTAVRDPDARTEALLVGVQLGFIGILDGQQRQDRCQHRHIRMLQCREVTCDQSAYKVRGRS